MPLVNKVKVEVLMNISYQEVRVGVIENGMLQEVHIERPNHLGIVGNIYKGKVVRVLPGMQAAFIDIGLDKAGFLHVSDLMPITEDLPEGIDFSSPETDIRKWLKEGQELLVQVRKDPLGSKGARLTAHLSLTSRYLVYFPELKHIGVSVRLENQDERDRLQSLLSEVLGEENAKGYIIRTVAEGIGKEALEQDRVFLEKLWKSMYSVSSDVKAPSIVYQDLPLVQRALRDMVKDNVEIIRVDCKETFEKLVQFSQDFVPGVKEKVGFL